MIEEERGGGWSGISTQANYLIMQQSRLHQGLWLTFLAHVVKTVSPAIRISIMKVRRPWPSYGNNWNGIPLIRNLSIEFLLAVYIFYKSHWPYLTQSVITTIIERKVIGYRITGTNWRPRLCIKVSLRNKSAGVFGERYCIWHSGSLHGPDRYSITVINIYTSMCRVYVSGIWYI